MTAVIVTTVCETISLCHLLCLSVGQDEAVVMGTVWRDGHGPAGLPDDGSVRGEPVHQGAAGTQHDLALLDFFSVLSTFVPVRHATITSCSNPERTLTHKKVHSLTSNGVSCQ